MTAREPKVPPNADDPAESERFIDTAREVEVDESPGAMDRAFERVVRPPKAPAAPGKGRPSP